MIPVITRDKYMVVECSSGDIGLWPDYDGYLVIYDPDLYINQNTGECYWHGPWEKPFPSLDKAYAYIKAKTLDYEPDYEPDIIIRFGGQN